MSRRARSGESGWSSLHLATVLGIPIRIHFTFLLLLVYIGIASRSTPGGPIRAVVYILLLFACVVLHELGHATMARRYGVKTREIVLYPIGGIARLEGMPSGKAELLIALAGPAVNVVLAALLALVIVWADLPRPWATAAMPAPLGEDLLTSLFFANVLLVLFNLIPAFPMDGGRVLRASLTFFLPEDRATHVAALVGQAVAMLFGAVGLVIGNPFLIFIAFFVFLGAAQEAAFHRTRSVVRGRRAKEAMVTRFESLAPQDSLEEATHLLLSTHQQDFPVIDAWGRIAGVITRGVLLRGLATIGKGGAVLEVMQREVLVVGPDENLEDVVRQLQSDPGAPVLVAEDGRLVGMITLENLAEMVEVVRAVKAGDARA
jgi:stage IV sporulation protein FB